MKKIAKKEIGKLFKEISNAYETPEIIEYNVGEETIEVEVYSTVTVGTKETLVGAAALAIKMRDYQTTFHHDCVLASLVVEHLTNIPLPKVRIDDEEITDLYTCYELVYGENGLIHKSNKISNLLDEVELRAYNVVKYDNDMKVASFFNKLSELYELIKMESVDMLENPARQLELADIVNKFKE